MPMGEEVSDFHHSPVQHTRFDILSDTDFVNIKYGIRHVHRPDWTSNKGGWEGDSRRAMCNEGLPVMHSTLPLA